VDGPALANRIKRYNRGRGPLVRRKYAKLTANPLTFFRGTCHLFYEDWPKGMALDDAPLVWIGGDCHLENFGVIAADNDKRFFDLNDFDEALLGPCSWDLARLLASLCIWASAEGAKPDARRKLARHTLDRYVEGLAEPNPAAYTQAAARGSTKDLLKRASKRSAAELLGKFSDRRGRKRLLHLDPRTLLAVADSEREALFDLFASARQTLHLCERYELVDLARRVTGTGSLGLRRYALLVSERRRRPRYYVVDLKQAVPSALLPYVPWAQPSWDNNAQRVVQVQRWVRGAQPRFLEATVLGTEAFVARELRPTEDGLDTEDYRGKRKHMRDLIDAIATVTAHAHIRGCGEQGAGEASALRAWAEDKSSLLELVDYAEQYANQVHRDWETYCLAFDNGELSG
jgi:uncharacterized protein (DUF2252 family)